MPIIWVTGEQSEATSFVRLRFLLDEDDDEVLERKFYLLPYLDEAPQQAVLGLYTCVELGFFRPPRPVERPAAEEKLRIGFLGSPFRPYPTRVTSTEAL